MRSTDTAFLECLADCLEAGAVTSDALRHVARAGSAAEAWAERILRLARAEMPLATLLRTAKVIDDSECALLSAEGAGDLAAALLHVVAARRRRQLARRQSIQLGLVGPFGIAALTVVLDPIPSLITGGSYVWPVFRGFVVLGLLALGVVVGVPALLREKQRRTKVLGLCAVVPGLHWLAKLYAEEELTTALAPFVVGGYVREGGLRAASVLLGWSKLDEAMRLAKPVVDGSLRDAPLGGLEPIASQMTLATNLAVVGGVASKRLAERLTKRGEEIAVLLTARARTVVRVGAYGIIVLFSAFSLAGMVAQGLPGMPTLPGTAGNVDQKELEELMKQLEQQ